VSAALKEGNILAQGAEAVEKSHPTAGHELARLCRLLCGKPPAFRHATEPKRFIVLLFWSEGRKGWPFRTASGGALERANCGSV